MGKRNQLGSRSADEKQELATEVHTDVPEQRFQGNQQIQNPVEDVKASKPGANPFVPKTPANKGSALKQEKVAEVITGTGGVLASEGMSSPSRAGLRTLAYSGNEGTILGTASGTPVVGAPSRSDTRPGQKMDAVAKAIDFIASEQVLQHFDGSKPLQENPDAVQGYLGHPENTSARVQKIREAVPGALLYARSVDEISRDEIVFARGQMIREDGVSYNVEPTMTYAPNADDNNRYIPFNIKRGNYVPKTLHLGVRNGKLVGMYFDVDDISITDAAAVVNQASSAFIRDMNQFEMNRQNMEEKAGVETKENWTPLVRAVAQPTQTVGYLDDDEVITATETFMAYRFLNKAHSYQFNKAGKDGQTPYRSFNEILLGNYVTANSSEAFTDLKPFSSDAYVNGAPSLFIPLYDSIAKYSKRGDIFTQPRSFKMHKQTADNNINQFRMLKQFGAYVAARDTFSTIDREYDPMLPVCITDNWRVSHVYDWRKLLTMVPVGVMQFKMGAPGVATAAGNFETLIATANASHLTTGKAVLQYHPDVGANTNIYDELNFGSGIRADAKVYALPGANDDHQYADKATGQAAAEALLKELLEAGNHAKLGPIVILYRVAVTLADAVFAVTYFPGIDTATLSLQLKVDTAAGVNMLNSDLTVATELLSNLVATNDYFTYKYQNRQNPYVVQVKQPLLHAIKEWAENLAPKLQHLSVSGGGLAMSTQEDDQDIIWFNIPIVHSTRNISTWDLIVCASIPFAQKIRTNSQFDTLNYFDANGVYPFEELDDIASINPLASVNYSMTNILEPLKCLQMKPSAALSWIMPEKFWRIKHEVVEGAVVTETFVAPFYFSEEKLKFAVGDSTIGITDADEGYVVNYPSTRAGIRSSFLDAFYGMTERDIRLCLDQMVRLPSGYIQTADFDEAGVYKYGLSNSGIPVITYSLGLTIGEYLKTPRELGLGMTAPEGYCSPACGKYYNAYDHMNGEYSTLSTLMSAGTSYKIRTWHVLGGQYKALHAAVQLIVDRGGNFSQEWHERGDSVYAPIDNVNLPGFGARKAAPDIGVAINFNDIMEVGADGMAGEGGKSLFKPFTCGNNTNNSAMPAIITLQNALWVKLQCLPFALSPFDQTSEGRASDDSYVVVDMTADPYDLLYVFGFVGFKGSDYREDVFNRIYEKQTLGWTYLKDMFLAASPVLKDGGLS